jgi:hypothetical protein
MKSWFIPPIVIPVVIAVSLAGYASLRAFQQMIDWRGPG